MPKFIDDFLNRTTMYRLVLYYLTALFLIALVLSFFGQLPFGPIELGGSVVFLIAVCWLINAMFSRVWNVSANIESFYITAFILGLIITPQSLQSISGLLFLFWAGVIAMASKYIVGIRGKHVFNPTAIAVLITAFALNQSASWWVGSRMMLPFVLIGGLLVVRKLIRTDLVISFLITAAFSILATSYWQGTADVGLLGKVILDTPIFFFAFVMLTEPLTTPPTRFLRILYGALVGMMYAPSIHFGSFYSTPELALVIGNIFSFVVSPKIRQALTLRTKTEIAPFIYSLRFAPEREFSFRPGQYLEWTGNAHHADTRGNRRFFTIASSPTEDAIELGVKVYPEPSTFKKSLLAMKPGDKIIASQLAGDFVLPRDLREKLVFIAGGIGVTPFRSMLKYLLDRDERRDVVLMYSAATIAEFVYHDVFDEAIEHLGIKAVYTLTKENEIPSTWRGERGPITKAMIEREVPDYRDRTFYISGPRAMVLAFERTLAEAGVPSRRIKTDFFPGYV